MFPAGASDVGQVVWPQLCTLVGRCGNSHVWSGSRRDVAKAGLLTAHLVAREAPGSPGIALQPLYEIGPIVHIGRDSAVQYVPIRVLSDLMPGREVRRIPVGTFRNRQ